MEGAYIFQHQFYLQEISAMRTAEDYISWNMDKMDATSYFCATQGFNKIIADLCCEQYYQEKEKVHKIANQL